MSFDINRVKISVTVPCNSTDKIRASVCDVGAGIIGKYTFCTSVTKTVGTFIPGDDANPYLGEKNKLKFVEEEKLEFVCNVDNVKKVVQELRKVHPYEEPAIDIIPLIDEDEFE